MSLTARERREVNAANESGRNPVVFVHGLWILASSPLPSSNGGTDRLAVC